MEENVINTGSAPVVETSQPSVDASASYEGAPVSNEPNASSEPASESSEPKVVASTDSMSVVVDPITGKRSISFNSGEQNTPEENEPSTGDSDVSTDDGSRGSDSVNIGASNVQNAEKYSLEEFSAALANGRVDASRVPQEYQAQYADYRIREAIQQRQAQQQAAFQQEQAKRQQIAQQMSPENRVQANKEFYNALEDEASQLALKDLGITQEQLDDAEFADDGEALKQQYANAKDWHKQRLRGEMEARYRQEQNYKYQQQSTYNSIQQFVEQERSKEPNFDAIDARLATRYKSLPYEQGRNIQMALQALQAGTINQAGVQVIQEYYNAVRKEYYAQRNGLQAGGPKAIPKKPPVVETAGSGQQVNQDYKPNYSSLRGANVNQRAAWFKEYFKNKGW